MKNRNHHFLTRLLLLLAVSAVWPALATRGQQPARSRPVHSDKKAISYAFVSPNTSENLTLAEAIAGLGSPEEQRLIGEARLVACRLHLALRVQKAVGSWTDGAEHSTVLRLATDETNVRYASAWLGKFARQKAVLYFRPNARGTARMFVLLLPSRSANLAALASGLDADGVENRTLVPRRRGVVIYIVDLKNELQEKVLTSAQRLRGRLSSLRGDGEFLGDENDRDKARVVFDREIMKYEASHPRVRRSCGWKASMTNNRPRETN